MEGAGRPINARPAVSESRNCSHYCRDCRDVLRLSSWSSDSWARVLFSGLFAVGDVCVCVCVWASVCRVVCNSQLSCAWHMSLAPPHAAPGPSGAAACGIVSSCLSEVSLPRDPRASDLLPQQLSGARHCTERKEWLLVARLPAGADSSPSISRSAAVEDSGLRRRSSSKHFL